MAKKRFRRKRKMIRQDSSNLIKLSAVFDVVTTASNRVNIVIHPRSLTNQIVPDYDMASPAVKQPQNFAKVKDLFDIYRAEKVSLRYIPSYNANENTTAESIQVNYPGVWIAFDYDNTGIGRVQDMMVNAQNKYKSLMERWSASFRLPKMQGPNSLPGGFSNLQTETQRLEGIINIQSAAAFGQTVAAGTPVGYMIVDSWYTFKKRSDHNIRAYLGINSAGFLNPPGETGPQTYVKTDELDGDELEFVDV